MSRQLVAHAHPVDIDTSCYRMHRLPGQDAVVLNDGYKGVFLLDLTLRKRSRTIPFSPAFAASGVVTQWCLRADGSAAIVVDAEARTACYLTLDGTERHDLDLPFDRVRDLRYSWNGASLWLTNGALWPWLRLTWRAGTPSFVEVSRLQVRAAEPAWWTALRLVPDGSTVERNEPTQGRMLLHEFGPSPTLGVISWSDTEPARLRTVPFAGQVPRLAYARNALFVMDEFVIQMVGMSGDVLGTIPAETGFEFADLETVGDRLVVLGHSLSRSTTSRIWQYSLTP